MGKKWKTAAAALLVAGALTLLAGLGALYVPDMAASDALYQNPQLFDGELVLVGMDDRALEELGPYPQWGRGVIAAVLEALNESEDCRPAVIALDVLYTGETDPELDQWLAEAAGQYGNVVVGSFVQYGDVMTEGGAIDYELAAASVRGRLWTTPGTCTAWSTSVMPSRPSSGGVQAGGG